MAKIEKKQTVGVIDGVLVYVKLAEPTKKYQKDDLEYTIQLLITEEQADAWEETFKKQPAKKIKAVDVEEKFRIENPYPGEKNIYSITLRKDATKNGQPFYPEFRPRLLIDMNDGTRVDATESRLCANGVRGKVSYKIITNDFGTTAKLQNVLVQEDDFIEYQSNTGGPGGEFGSAKAIVKEEAKESATKARASKAKEQPKQEEPAEEFDDMESPF